MRLIVLLIIVAFIVAANFPAWLRRRRWLHKARLGEAQDFKMPWERE